MKHYPRIVMISLWRNDEKRDIEARVRRLTNRSYPNVRYLWVYGDCSDRTGEILQAQSKLLGMSGVDIQIVRHDTGIPGDFSRSTATSRFVRLSQTVSAAFRCISELDTYAIIHESDLVSPVDLIERFLENADRGMCPIAGWPILTIGANQLFYDTWAYRSVGGKYFGNWAERPAVPFEVESFGSVAMFRASDLENMDVRDLAFREICANVRTNGRTLWCDPSITVEQPKNLWED